MKEMNKTIIVYDIETFVNLFTFTSYDVNTKEYKSFIIWKNQNDINEFISYLNTVDGMIGYNNIGFDYPVVHYILKNSDNFLKYSGEKLASLIYKQAQRTIEMEWPMVKDPFIPQLDLFSIWHFNSKANLVSLKKLEIAMKYNNVQDIPYHHSKEVETEDQIIEILDYNKNDVDATYEFYLLSTDKIELRKDLYRKYKINCLNYSDSKIGEEVMLKLYCDYTNHNIDTVRKLRTRRTKFRFIDCIPEYINFKTDEFNGLLNYLKTIEVTELKDSFKYEFEYDKELFYYGTGGLHQATKEGIYEANENVNITDFDVTGLYPSLIVNNNIYPGHLGNGFCKLFAEMIKIRNEAKKSGDKITANSLKLSNNSCFGKFNSEYSWLFDSLAALRTTLAGQLSLSMLIEMLYLSVPDIKMIQSNTDGATAIYNREYENIFYDTCKEWEILTKLNLEYAEYSKVVIRDVNNYISISKDGKIKRKGLFKLHDEMRADGEWQKGFNSEIVPLALSKFYIEGIPVEETIRNSNDIYSFCKSFNVRGYFFSETLEKDDNGNEINLTPQQKNVRYYISNDGVIFRKRSKPLKPKWKKETSEMTEHEHNIIHELDKSIEEKINYAISNNEIEERSQAKLIISIPDIKYKILNKYISYLSGSYKVSNVELIKTESITDIDVKMDWRIIDIESNSLVTIFNKFEHKDMMEYNINYDYYINECKKITETINHNLEKEKQLQKELKERDKKEREAIKYIEQCVNKLPTERIYKQYRKEWMDDVFSPIVEFKKSPNRKHKDETL